MRRTRPSHRRRNPMWPRRTRDDWSGVTLATILKHKYPSRVLGGEGPIFAKPWWAELAYARRWMTASQYYAVPEVDTGRRMKSLFAPSPLFDFLRRDR